MFCRKLPKQLWTKQEKESFLFPKDPERCKKWMIACRRADLDGKDNQDCIENFFLFYSSTGKAMVKILLLHISSVLSKS